MRPENAESISIFASVLPLTLPLSPEGRGGIRRFVIYTLFSIFGNVSLRKRTGWGFFEIIRKIRFLVLQFGVGERILIEERGLPEWVNK